MANRGIRELLALAVVDYRFYLGNINDYSGNGNDAIWQAGAEPEFRGEVGGAVGLDFPLGGGDLIATPAIAFAGPFAYEIMMYARSTGGGGFGRVLDPVDGNCTFRWNGNNLRIECGSFWNVAYTPPGILHAIVTRDGSDDGFMYFDGVPQGTSPVGGDAVNAQVRIGNQAALNRAIDAVIYSVRILNDVVDPDEAARLYEHSRIQLWPGAPKRSGIISPVV